MGGTSLDPSDLEIKRDFEIFFWIPAIDKLSITQLSGTSLTFLHQLEFLDTIKESKSENQFFGRKNH